MRRTIGLGAVLLIAVNAGLAGGQGSVRWVERIKVDVRAGRGSFYELVDTVLRGEQVQFLAAEARWQQVQTPRGRKGWVFETALAAKPVERDASEFLKLAPGDASTSATAASAGAKGVYAEGYARQKGYDYSVVTYIETHQPTAAQIEAFVRAGGLAPPGSPR